MPMVKFRSTARCSCLRPGYEFFAQGLSQVQQQMYEQDQRMADMRKARTTAERATRIDPRS